MPPTRQAISNRGAADPSPVVLIDCAVARSAEVSGLLSKAGYHVSRLGFDRGLVEALGREKPRLLIASDRTIEDEAARSRGIRSATLEIGIPLMLVTERRSDPSALSRLVAECDDWISASAIESELVVRVTRLLERQPARERPAGKVPPGTSLLAFPQAMALIVHDLRTPLNVIVLSLRMIGQAMPKGDVELEEDLRFVQENFRQIERMLSLLSDYYRLHENEHELDAAEFEPRRFVGELLEEWRSKNGSTTSPIELEVLDTCPTVVCLDPVRTRLALHHAVGNAKAAANGAIIRMTLGGSERRWVTEIAIDEPAPASVGATTLGPSSYERLCGFAAERRGMDLAIAAKVSELFGGSARLELTASRGTVVVLDWPERLPAT